MLIRKLFGKVNYPENKQLINKFTFFKNCVILGSAPTINNHNLNNISKDDMIMTMGNFHEHIDIDIIQPHIHIFAASHEPITENVLKSWWERANKKLPNNTLILIERRDEVLARKIFLNRKIFVYSYGGQLPINFTKKIMSPWSVTIVALQLSIYIQKKKIFLLGVDHDWQCIKPYEHFYNHDKPSLEYYLKQKNISISYEEQKAPLSKERLYREYELYQQYEALKDYAQSLGLNIYNGDKFSSFDVFDKKEYKF